MPNEIKSTDVFPVDTKQAERLCTIKPSEFSDRAVCIQLTDVQKGERVEIQIDVDAASLQEALFIASPYWR